MRTCPSVAVVAAVCLTALGGPVAARPVNSAEAHCVVTGVTGYGKSTRSAEDAIEKAVAACIGKGGVPACCRKGARPL